VTGLTVPLSIDIAGLKFSTALVETFVFSLSIIILFQLLIKRTMFGITLRALVEDKETTSLMGVNPNTRLLLSVAVVSAISGVAGFFYMRSFGGTLILAITENIIGTLISVSVKDIAAVIVIIVSLILKYREV
jgi:branched-subunit amino acid ABC-type transport system permease component